MAYDLTKLTKLESLKELATRIKMDFATKSSLSELEGRVDEIVSTGGEPNKLEGVKVNGEALAIADKMVDILISSGTENGKINVNGKAVAITGLAALAYKSKISASDLEDALKTVIDNKANSSDVSAIESEISILKGTGNGSVKKTVDSAINDFATKVSDDGTVNTIKELVDWVASHGSEASEMASGISENSTEIESIKTLIGTIPSTAEAKNVVSYITEVVDSININNYVEKVDGSRLMTDVEGTKLSGIADGATKTESSDTNGNVKINGTDVVVYTEPTDVVHGSIATSAEVTEMLNEVFGA